MELQMVVRKCCKKIGVILVKNGLCVRTLVLLRIFKAKFLGKEGK